MVMCPPNVQSRSSWDTLTKSVKAGAAIICGLRAAGNASDDVVKVGHCGYNSAARPARLVCG